MARRNHDVVGEKCIRYDHGDLSSVTVQRRTHGMVKMSAVDY